MTDSIINARGIALIAGAALSLIFSLFPPARKWLNDHASDYQVLIMDGVIIAVGIIWYTLGCANFIVPTIPCDRPGLFQVLTVIVSAIVGNQGTFMATPDKWKNPPNERSQQPQPQPLVVPPSPQATDSTTAQRFI